MNIEEPIKKRGRKPAVHGGFTKRMIVRKYQKWGNEAGQVDMSSLYLIRKIGEKQAILDRLDPKTMEKHPYRRGRSEWLGTEADYMSRQTRNTNYPVNVWDNPYHWSHVFVQVGNEGWDPDF